MLNDNLKKVIYEGILFLDSSSLSYFLTFLLSYLFTFLLSYFLTFCFAINLCIVKRKTFAHVTVAHMLNDNLKKVIYEGIFIPCFFLTFLLSYFLSCYQFVN